MWAAFGAFTLSWAGPGACPDVDTCVEELRASRVALDRALAESEAQRAQLDALLRALREGDDARGVPAPLALPSAAEASVSPSPEADPHAAQGSLTLIPTGTVVAEAVALGEDLVVEGRVRGNATALGGDVRVRPGGVVHGDALAVGGRVYLDPGGQIDGDRIGLAQPRPEPGPETEGLSSWLYRKVVKMLTLGGAGVLAIGLMPARVARTAQVIADQPVQAGAIGTVAATAGSLSAGLIVLFTLGLGAPIGLFVMLALALAWLLGFVAACQALGDRLPLDPPNGRWVALGLCTALVVFAPSLGWLGYASSISLGAAAIGAALITRYGTRT